MTVSQLQKRMDTEGVIPSMEEMERACKADALFCTAALMMAVFHQQVLNNPGHPAYESLLQTYIDKIPKKNDI